MQDIKEYNTADHFVQDEEVTYTVLEKALGIDHPDTATSYNNIGTVYFARGNYGEALEWLEKALAVYVKVLGTEHPFTKITQKGVDLTKRRLSDE